MALFREVHRDTYERNSTPQGPLLVKLGKICSTQRIIASFVIIMLICFAFIMYVEIGCDKKLSIGLEDFTVRNMTVAHMNDSMPWELTTNIDITIAVRNPNALLRSCTFKLRRVELSVRFGNNLITSLSLYFGTFSLEPRRRHAVSTTVKVERSQVLSDQDGKVLEVQLRKDNVTLELEIDAQYSVRGSSLVVNHKECVVVAKTPQIDGSSSGHGRGFSSANCVEKVTA